MKKLINRPEDFVRESLQGLAAAHGDLVKVHFDPTFVCRADAPATGRVAIVTGGGSGHEPMHAGFVGPGMLDAVCPGEVFTSPTPDQMLAAARAVHSGSGVLFLVKNYSGDVMNFEMAAELATAEGIEVANVLVDDDVAVEDSLYTQGRRGVGTTVLVEKIGGAAAAAGYDLARLAALCQRASSAGRSMGVALTSCIPPAKGSPIFTLGEEEIEIGIGIHGEPGRRRAPLAPADELARQMTLAVLDDPPYTRTLRRWDGEAGQWVDEKSTDEPFGPGDRAIALVNGMGGTPLAELYVVFRKMIEVCREREIAVVRSLVGSYVTSLEMQGCSITLLRADDEMLELWDAPVETPALRRGA